MPKAALYENQVRGLHKVVKDCLRNYKWQKTNDNQTKRKKRKTIIKNVLYAGLFNQMKAVKFLNQTTYEPDQEAYYMFRCLYNFIPKVDTYAARIVESKDEGFQTWLRFHSFHFPEDSEILTSLIDDSVKITIDIKTCSIGDLITKFQPKKKDKKRLNSTLKKKKSKTQPLQKRGRKESPIRDMYQIQSSMIHDETDPNQSNSEEVDFDSKISTENIIQSFLPSPIHEAGHGMSRPVLEYISANSSLDNLEEQEYLIRKQKDSNYQLGQL